MDPPAQPQRTRATALDGRAGRRGEDGSTPCRYARQDVVCITITAESRAASILGACQKVRHVSSCATRLKRLSAERFCVYPEIVSRTSRVWISRTCWRCVAGANTFDRVRAFQRAHPLSAVRQLPHQRRQTQRGAAVVPGIFQRPVTEFLCVLGAVHRAPAGRCLRLDSGCDESAVGCCIGASQAPRCARHAGRRCIARPGPLCGRGQQHQERGVAPYPRTSGEHGRCVACTQTRRMGARGARRQFRFSSLERKPSC